MMNKFILLVAFMSCGMFSTAQVFFSEDFSGGIPGSWTNIDNSFNNIVWKSTLAGASSVGTAVDEQLNPIGTTAGNGYLIYDSDSAGSLPVAVDAIITTPAINCTGHTAVHLMFNEYFAQYGASTANVDVSIDNATWINVHQAHQGLTQDQGTMNPSQVDIDISAIAANQATTYIRFRFQGNYDYWWFVDDVQLFEPAPTDLSVFQVQELNTTYSIVPLSQQSSLTLIGDIENNGLNATTGGTALFEVVDSANTNIVFSEVINLPSLIPGSYFSVAPTGTLAIVTGGKYKSRITVNIPGDGIPGNDVKESSLFFISDSVYARDNGVISGVLPIAAGAGEDGAVGHNFRIYNTANLTSVSVFLADTLTQNYSNTPFFVTVHPQPVDTLNPDGTSLLATSETLFISGTTIPAGGSFFTLAFPGGVQLTPGLYFFAMHEIDSLIPLAHSSGIFSPNSVWVHWNTIPSPPAINGWAAAEDFFIFPVYLLRANFGQVPDGINEISETNCIVYPNPSKGIFHINFNLPVAEAKATILDMLGNEVLHLAINNNSTIDATGLANGLYFVKVEISGKEILKKIVINH